tara:strand:+ start:268 stop:552 length:285 start_codon:yes stop_codon:yes gene_type:complete
MSESIITQLLNESQLTEQKKDLLVGEICAEYERLRYNGTEKQVMRIYESERNGNEDNYIREKTRKYFRSGEGFASYLETARLYTLGEILRENVE